MDTLIYQTFLAILAGAAGGWVSHNLAFRLFRKQSKFDVGLKDLLKKRDALRDSLTISRRISRGLTIGWYQDGETDADRSWFMGEWKADLESYASLFPKGSDAQRALNILISYVGTDPAAEAKSGINSSKEVFDARAILETELDRLDKELSI